MAAYLSEKDLRDREARRLVLAKAEVSTQLAERELATWNRHRSASRSSHSTQPDSSFHSLYISASTPRLPPPLSVPTSPYPAHPSFHYISKQELNRTLVDKNAETRQRLQTQKDELTHNFNLQLEECRQIYTRKIQHLEDLLAKQSASNRNSQEIEKYMQIQEKLERELNEKSMEITNLRKQTDFLQEKSAQDEAKIRNLTDLISKKVDFEGKIRTLEHEKQLLKKDYEALASLHRRVLNEQKGSGSNRSSPLRRRPDDIDESASLRQYYDQRCLDLHTELLEWKEKVKVLTIRHYQALQSLQREKKELQLEVERMGEEMREWMREAEGKIWRQGRKTAGLQTVHFPPQL